MEHTTVMKARNHQLERETTMVLDYTLGLQVDVQV